MKETLEEYQEALKQFPEYDQYLERIGFESGAKWQQERSYSEEDLRNAFFSFPDEWICFEEWFEQFKKK